MKELLERLLQGARDLKYYIDIQPPDKPVRHGSGAPVMALHGYRNAAKAITDAEKLLSYDSRKRNPQ